MESTENTNDIVTENQCQKMLNLLKDLNLFHSEDGTCFVEIKVQGAFQNWPIKNEKVFGVIQELYYDKFKTLPDEKNIKKVQQNLAFRSQKNPKEKVYYRVAAFENKIYIDLANSRNTFIQIDKNGWSEVYTVPIKFYKSNSMKPMCIPKQGGSILNLKKFININSEQDFILFLSYIVGSLFPSKQYPLLILQGPQGSGKSTASDILKEIIDPSIPTLRTFPKKEEDIFIGAKYSHLMCFDNLSGINASMSDTLCKISTGCGIAGRKYYTNDEEYFIEVTRPIVINGIDELTSRPDLADRSIVLYLEKLTEADRKSSSQMTELFMSDLPYIFGCLCDALSTVIQKRSEVHLNRKPRMVDFCITTCAGLQAFGYSVNEVLSAFMTNKAEIANEALEYSFVGSAVKRFMENKSFWQGSASELLAILNSDLTFSSFQHYPKSPNQISRELNRVDRFHPKCTALFHQSVPVNFM